MKNSLIASLLIVAGLALSYVMARQIIESLAPYGWQQIECLIERSDVVFEAGAEGRCKHILQYHYEIDGVRKTGGTWRRDPGVPYSWCSAWSSFAGEFPPSTRVSCYVDPQDSSRVVLDRGNIYSVFKLIVPIGLILIGASMLRFKSSIFPPSKAVVKRIAQAVALGVLLGGVIGTYYSGVLPLYKSYDSRTWNRVECEVLSSSLRTSSASAASSSGGSQNRGYYLEIVYNYVVNGRTYVSDRYDFSVFGSGSVESLAMVTDRYPVGAKVPCAMKFENPYEAVLEPGFSAKYLWGLLPLAAAFIGSFLFSAARKI